MLWKEWSGHYAVRSYDTCHEREYFAIRHAAGLIDVSPLFKVEVRGADAGELLSRVTVRDVCRLRVGRVTYLCWCDDDGRVIDDGTVSRIEDEHYRLTANGPVLAWLQRHALGLSVTLEDSTDQLGALALQGPESRAILAAVSGIERLRYFRLQAAHVGRVPVLVSRTGYTGDLGYEIWVDRHAALEVWDALTETGRAHGLAPGRQRLA